MKDKGIYLADGTFVSEKEIKRRLSHDETRAQFISRLPRQKALHDYLETVEKRTQEVRKLSDKSDNLVSVGVLTNAIIAFMGDLHVGHPNADHKRIEDEINAIADTPGVYAGLMGDVVDGIFFGGESQGENVLSLSEQRGFLNAIWSALKGKLLFAVSGEHDSKWAAKTGGDPYDQFTEKTGAPYVRGIAEVEVKSGDETYKVVAGHKKRGSSMYNNTHPNMRDARFGIQGADIYVSGHTHRKGINQETIRDFGDKSHEVTHVSVGTYKSGDAYSEREGFNQQTKDQQGGVAVKLTKRGGKKHVETDPDIVEAIKKWTE